jgi:hypothetical protein
MAVPSHRQKRDAKEGLENTTGSPAQAPLAFAPGMT